MWMGTVRGQGLVGNEVKEIIGNFEQESLPGIAQIPGFLGTVVGTNQARGAALSMTFWATEEALGIADDAYADAQEERQREWNRTDPYVNETFRIIFTTEVHSMLGGPVTPFMHLTHHSGLAADALDQLAGEYAAECQRWFDTARGAEGTLIGVNREDGTIAVITFWGNERDMRETIRARPEKAAARGGRTYVDSFELGIERNLDELPVIAASAPSPG